MTDPTAAVDDYPMATRTATRAPTVNADADRMRPLPDGWRWVRLRDICHKITDGTHQPPPFTLTGIPFLFVRNIVSGRIDFNVEKYVSQATYEELTLRCRPNRGDVLYSAVGSFGVAVVIETDEPFTFQRHIAHLKLRPDVADPHFLAYYINSPGGKRQSEDAALGGAQRTVALASLANFLIPLPPLRDQRRIAAILREQLTAVERARAAAEAQMEAARALPAAYLRAVFESDEAQQWPLITIGELAETCSGTTPSRSNKGYYDGEIPWVKTGELRDGDIADTEEHVTDAALRETALALLPEQTLLIAMYGQGQTRGRTGLLRRPATTNQACLAILPNARFAPRHLQYWFRHNYSKLRSASEGRGGNQPNLNGDIIRSQAVQLPALSRQIDIAATLDEHMAGAQQLRNMLQDQLDTIEALPAALLRQAFNGEL